jgi:hypothetical protein
LQPVAPRRDGLLAVRSQVQQAREITNKLNLQPAVLWHQPYFLDQGAQRLSGLGAQFGPV